METHAVALHRMVGAGHELHGAQRGRALAAGWLEVVAGRAWITQDGGGDDHVLGAGERLVLARGAAVVLEPFHAGQPVRLRWRAAPPQAGLRTRLAPGARGLAARGLLALAGRLAAWARSAEAMARRAQGSICAGESIASSGALQ